MKRAISKNIIKIVVAVTIQNIIAKIKQNVFIKPFSFLKLSSLNKNILIAF